MKELGAWVLLSPKGSTVAWFGAVFSRQQAISKACEGCMGATDYERLKNDKQRWGFLIQSGYRLVRAMVSFDPTPTPNSERHP